MTANACRQIFLCISSRRFPSLVLTPYSQQCTAINPFLTPAETKILVLLSASVERFGVSRMRDFLFTFLGFIGGASQQKICYQWGLPLLVSSGERSNLNKEIGFISRHSPPLPVCTVQPQEIMGFVLIMELWGTGHCTAQNCTIHHCTALHCTVLHCTVLQSVLMPCTCSALQLN